MLHKSPGSCIAFLDPLIVSWDIDLASFGSPRTLFATAIMRAAYSGDVQLVRLLLSYGADPSIRNSDNEGTLLAAAGYAWIDGYSQGRSTEERLQTIKLLVELGLDVNWACDHGITPLMMAANFGKVELIQYLVDQGADLSAHDLGKRMTALSEEASSR